MADKTCAVRLDSFAVRREYDSAHGAFIRPNLASSDIDGMAFGDYAGKASIVFEMYFTAACTGGLKCKPSAMCVGCFVVTGLTQAVWVSWIYRKGDFADGTTGCLQSRRLGCHGIN